MKTHLFFVAFLIIFVKGHYFTCNIFDIMINMIHRKEEYIPNIPYKCETDGFCLDYNGEYPTKYIENIYPAKFMDVENINGIIDQEINSEDSSEVCRSENRVVEFKVAKYWTTDGDDYPWYYIINTPYLKQHLHTVRCEDANDTECKFIESPESIESKCVQETHTRDLYALDHAGRLFRGRFIIPMCCQCKTRDLRK